MRIIHFYLNFLIYLEVDDYIPIRTTVRNKLFIMSNEFTLLINVLKAKWTSKFQQSNYGIQYEIFVNSRMVWYDQIKVHQCQNILFCENLCLKKY